MPDRHCIAPGKACFPFSEKRPRNAAIIDAICSHDAGHEESDAGWNVYDMEVAGVSLVTHYRGLSPPG